MTKPHPGIHRGIDMADYHSWDAASNSRLSRLLQSPAHLKAYLDGDMPDTPALRFGRAAHAAILEPDIFEVNYRCAPNVDRRTKAGREAWAEFIEGIDPEKVLTPEDHAACLAMRDSVHSMRTASGLLSGHGDIELSCVWEDADTGVLCKGRFDRLSDDVPGRAIIDLKTCRDARWRFFQNDVNRYGYHRQGALYLAGAKALGIDVQHYVILAVEKAVPFGCIPYRMRESDLEVGMEVLRPLLRRYAELIGASREEWPCYPDEVVDIGIPDWAFRTTKDLVLELEARP